MKKVYLTPAGLEKIKERYRKAKKLTSTIKLKYVMVTIRVIVTSCNAYGYFQVSESEPDLKIPRNIILHVCTSNNILPGISLPKELIDWELTQLEKPTQTTE